LRAYLFFFLSSSDDPVPPFFLLSSLFYIVCGITNVEDALTACQSGASLIGLIFVPNSKRFITTETAKSVVEAVRNFGERKARIDIPLAEYSKCTSNSSPVATLTKKSRALQNECRSPLVVGVFQNTEVEVLTSIVDEVGLDLVQLHGDEGMEVYAKCTVPAIRVIHVVSSTDDCCHRSELAKTVVSSLTSDPVAILLDTSVKGAKGGTGVTFDWTLAKEIQNMGLPVIVAGGLNAENVEELVVKVGPWGVDVSSGVEESPGKKDLNKVVAFISNAKKAAEQGSKMF
jgi:phosphoribosylanthranilate isomerase